MSVAAIIAAASVAVVLAGGRGDDASSAASSDRASAAQVAALLASDMSERSEVLPHGVPLRNDWARHPRAGEPVGVPGFSAFTAWGQIYRCAGSRAEAPPVELRDLQAWAYYPGDGWVRLQRSSHLSGGAYAEDFHRNRSVPALIRKADSTATVVKLRAGYNFHFWPRGGRVTLRRAKATAYVVSMRARYAAPALASDCAVLSVGADFWRTATAPFAGSGTNNVDAGIGRFKRVSRDWRVFTMTTVISDAVRASPPPLGLAAPELR